MHGQADTAMNEEHQQAIKRLRASLAPGQASQALIACWRAESALVAALPERFGEVLEGLLTRYESAAAFGEESCSFSVVDLRAQLMVWLDKADARLSGR
ncbi:MAG: hypothetical protein RL322_874 [Pseudomonadota bacterium]|jgi:hypothetical protein